MERRSPGRQFTGWRNRSTQGPNAPIRAAFPDLYIRTGAYTLANINVKYQVTENVEFAGGVRNLLDQNYELVWGLPQPGRTFYAKVRAGPPACGATNAKASY